MYLQFNNAPWKNMKNQYKDKFLQNYLHNQLCVLYVELLKYNVTA